MKRILFFVLTLTIFSCTKVEKDSLPYAPVYLEVDLTYADKQLLNLFSHKIFTSYKGQSLGVGGVLVFHGMDYGGGAYHAFDLACPFEANSSTKVAVDDTGIFAVCPKCKSKYELSAQGFPTDHSVSDEKLRSYPVQQMTTSTHQVLIIRN